jgi:hypothetical protein
MVTSPDPFADRRTDRNAAVVTPSLIPKPNYLLRASELLICWLCAWLASSMFYVAWGAEPSGERDSKSAPLLLPDVSDLKTAPTTVVKPDFAAPGQWFTAAARASLEPQAKLDSTGFYRPFSGTSAAAPYTAGVVALMLEANPTLTLDEIKNTLHASVSPPPKSDRKCPNPKWGYGKLDLAAVKKVLGQRKNELPTTPANTQ